MRDTFVCYNKSGYGDLLSKTISKVKMKLDDTIKKVNILKKGKTLKEDAPCYRKVNLLSRV